MLLYYARLLICV